MSVNNSNEDRNHYLSGPIGSGKLQEGWEHGEGSVLSLLPGWSTTSSVILTDFSGSLLPVSQLSSSRTARGEEIKPRDYLREGERSVELLCPCRKE